MAAPVVWSGGLAQVVGSEVQAVLLEPKFAVALLQVHPVYQALFSVHAAPIRNGDGVLMKNEDSGVGSKMLTAFSVAPLKYSPVPVSVLVKVSLLLFEPAPNAVATWVALIDPVPRYLVALHWSTTERAVSVAGVVPDPFIRMHSLLGATMIPLTSVVSELPRNSEAA